MTDDIQTFLARWRLTDHVCDPTTTRLSSCASRVYVTIPTSRTVALQQRRTDDFETNSRKLMRQHAFFVQTNDKISKKKAQPKGIFRHTAWNDRRTSPPPASFYGCSWYFLRRSKRKDALANLKWSEALVCHCPSIIIEKDKKKKTRQTDPSSCWWIVLLIMLFMLVIIITDVQIHMMLTFCLMIHHQRC